MPRKRKALHTNLKRGDLVILNVDLDITGQYHNIRGKFGLVVEVHMFGPDSSVVPFVEYGVLIQGYPNIIRYFDENELIKYDNF